MNGLELIKVVIVQQIMRNNLIWATVNSLKPNAQMFDKLREKYSLIGKNENSAHHAIRNGYKQPSKTIPVKMVLKNVISIAVFQRGKNAHLLV